MKFATGGPMQVAERPRPAKVTEVGARARPIGLGLMPVTHNGHGRVSFTVSVMLPTSAQLPAPVWLYTCTCTVPAASPGSGSYRLVAFVGNGTRSEEDTAELHAPRHPLSRALLVKIQPRLPQTLLL